MLPLFLSQKNRKIWQKSNTKQPLTFQMASFITCGAHYHFIVLNMANPGLWLLRASTNTVQDQMPGFITCGSTIIPSYLIWQVQDHDSWGQSQIQFRMHIDSLEDRQEKRVTLCSSNLKCVLSHPLVLEIDNWNHWDHLDMRPPHQYQEI